MDSGGWLVRLPDVAEAEVVSLKFQPPSLLGRDGYWEAEAVLDGKSYTMSFPDKPDFAVGEKIKVRVVPCNYKSLICRVSLVEAP